VGLEVSRLCPYLSAMLCYMLCYVNRVNYNRFIFGPVLHCPHNPVSRFNLQCGVLSHIVCSKCQTHGAVQSSRRWCLVPDAASVYIRYLLSSIVAWRISRKIFWGLLGATCLAVVSLYRRQSLARSVCRCSVLKV